MSVMQLVSEHLLRHGAAGGHVILFGEPAARPWNFWLCERADGAVRCVLCQRVGARAPLPDRGKVDALQRACGLGVDGRSHFCVA